MTARTAYDEVRYSNYPYAQTHPDRLATIAALHGLRPPDPAHARVLEIGCGAGGNLMAMAVATPGIRALGVDLAGEVIAEATQVVAAVGIDNLELRQGDVMELTGGELGEFDYVIAHGVYAWIPEPARDALLAAVHSHLAADGLGYISYNAHPGGYLRRVLREAGQWFARDAEEPAEQAERAQELYRFMLENRAGTNDWWGALLESQLPPFASGPIYRLVHDDLSPHWRPVWFTEFAEHAARHRLAYVGEGDLGSLLPERIPGTVDPALRELVGPERIAYEQSVDILRCAFFRQSIVCRDGLAPAAAPVPDSLRNLHFSVRTGSDDAAAPEGLLGSAVALLRSRRPDTVPFAELRAAAGAEPDELARVLLEGFEAELVMPHSTPLRTAAVGEIERPAASRLARHQARQDTRVTSLAYVTVHMEEPAARLLITLLDGTRDRAAIRAEFAERTGVRLSAEDLESNLEQLAALFLIVPGDG